MDNREIRKHKELSHLREGVISDWRKDLNEEHPYVDVMPSSGQKQKDAEKKMKELKKAQKAVKEELITELTAQERANKDKASNSITDLFTGDSPERRAARRAQASGDKAGIAKGKSDENARAAREKAERERQRATAEKTRDSFSSPTSKPAVKEFEKPSLKPSTETKTKPSTETKNKPTFGTKGINPRTGKPYSETPGKSGTEPKTSPVEKTPPASTPAPKLGSTGKTKSEINTEYDRLRKSGDVKGAEKYGKSMNQKIFSKPSTTPTPKPAAPKPTAAPAPKPTAAPAPKPAAPAPKPSNTISSPRLNKALSGVKKFTPKM